VVDQFIAAVQGLQHNAFAPVLFIGVYALACLFMPISVFPVAGSVMFGFWGGLVCNITGITSGAYIAYWLARKYGRVVLEKLAPRQLKKFESFTVQKTGFTTLLIIRLIGLPPFGILNYLCGLAGISNRTYLAATFLGVLPYTIFETYFANVLWQILLTSGMIGFKAALLHHMRPVLIGGISVAVLLVGISLLKKKNSHNR
jgi:uncharacterized membrane protein YdjX (TVP38/TMEM64 family)